jgi:hypothetical protein
MAGMLTMRIHIDPVQPGNSPLKILCGSHRRGRLQEADIASLAQTLPVGTCLAAPGDIWVYSRPITHASDQQAEAGRRRVLQVDYADFALPGELGWAYADLHCRSDD